MDELDGDDVQGEAPDGVGPEVFREHLRRATERDPVEGAVIQFDEEAVLVADIASVEAEEGTGGQRSRVRLRNGLVIGGLSGAAILAALATIRYRRRHHK